YFERSKISKETSTKTTESENKDINKEQIFIDLPFIRNETKILGEKVINLAKNIRPDLHIQPIPRPPPTISTFFPQKDKIGKNAQSNIVYMISCLECNESYLGKTIRQASRRYQGHGAPQQPKLPPISQIATSAVDNQQLRRYDHLRAKAKFHHFQTYDYVNKPDPVFAWKLIKTHYELTHTTYILNMTSQQWFDASFSSRSIWWHYMVITVPRIHSRPKTAYMLIGGETNLDPVPKRDSWGEKISVKTGTVAVEVKQIPSQPITFVADPSQKSRFEDDILAWTWNTFIQSNGSDPSVLLLLPMTKASVRAMDAAQQFLREKEIPVPEKFVITGGSKSLDGWTFALYSYYVENITRSLDNPYYQVAADIFDPYAYFDRYHNVTLCQFQGADDEFFLSDSEDYFWNDLQKATGGSYLYRIPNTDHGATGVFDSLESFYFSICEQQVLPSWTWTRTINGTHGQIRANVSVGDGHPSPINVTVYQAQTVTGTKRDFRAAKLDPTTGQIVVNPVKWVEMKENMEIV
ncbi:unnamed protein product, partial [Rotaria sp. Silwood2]